LQFVSTGLGGGDQLAIELALFVLPAAVFDDAGPLLGQAPPGSGGFGARLVVLRRAARVVWLLE